MNLSSLASENEWVRSWDKRGKILQQMKVWILKWGYYRMSETLLEFWNLFKVDEDSVPLTFVTYECQSFFVTYTMLKNLIKIKMKSPLKLDQLVYVVPIFSLQMLFQFFVLLWHNSAELPSSQCKLDLGAARKSVTSNVHFCAASSYFPHIFVEAYFCL